jgi:eukaryotic-like serine/threonine-protein kinase
MARPIRQSFGPGDQVGPYRLEAELGHGGMGQVFRARDSRLGRVVAIKFIRPEFASDEEFRRRFTREARTISTLNHPHVCALYDIAEHDGCVYLVMEYVEGETLDTVLAERALSTHEVRKLAAEIAAALGAAHAHGIVHRDLKPGNIMVTPFGAKVLDFGLAKEVARLDSRAETTLAPFALTEPGRVVGTPSYMSPEQIASRPVDARSDIFAAGVIVYEMLSGHHPFRGQTGVETMAAILQATPEPLSGRGRAIPRDLIAIVTRCLQKSPADRFASGSELLRALGPRQPSPANAAKAWWVAASCAGLLIAVAGYFGWSRYQSTSRAKWVDEIAVPEISRLIYEDRGLAALKLFRQAEQYAPASRSLIKVSEGVATRPVEFQSSPPGATLYISDYTSARGNDLSQWDLLGTTPLTVEQIPTWGYYRLRAVKPGYATTDAILGGENALSIALPAASEVPAGMVWIPPMSVPSPGVTLPGYWLGRHEVTNGQFKRFVDAGGYQKEQYWTEPIVKDGRTLSKQEAAAEFRDRTGRPGPSTWELSAFPAGAENLPVTGVSWYEAAAYAAFAGEHLPTLHEWNRAAGTSVNAHIIRLSNFGAKGPVAVGSGRGMSPFGSFDMAGNVKEWTSTGVRNERYVLGGSWDEPPYMFSSRDARLPLSREGTIGFRTIKRVEPPPAGIFDPVPRDTQTLPKPVSEAEYLVYEGLHRYESSPLDTRTERVADGSPYFRRETVSFRAAYGNERVVAHVFLPRNVSPPYQVVIVLGGVTIAHVLRRVEDFDYPFEFIVRSGRAVVIPALSGTLERGPSPPTPPPSRERERALRWSSDIGRTLDYLDARGDLDTERLGIYALSRGAVHAVRLLAIYPRFKAAVLCSGGMQMSQPPEVSAWTFAPRVQAPVLMVNGRYDFIFPVETNQNPLFRALGTKEPDKRHVLYDGGHRNLVTRPDLIGEVIDWFDRYLGPTQSR